MRLRQDHGGRGTSRPPSEGVVEDGRGLPLRRVQPLLHHRGHHHRPREGAGQVCEPAAARQVLRLRGPSALGVHRHRGQRVDPRRTLACAVDLPRTQVGVFVERQSVTVYKDDQ